MKYIYVAIGVTTGIIWVSAFVCAIIAGIRRESPITICSWLILAVVTLIAGRLAGSLLKDKMGQHVKEKKENSDSR